MYMKPRRPFSVAAVAAVCVCFAAFLAPARETGWRVAELNGAPGLYRDGQPVAPVFFWQWELLDEDVRAMAGAGINLFTTFGSLGHYANPYWLKEGFGGMAYQTEVLDRVRALAPQAALLPRLFYTAPDWWTAEHPGECVVYTNPNVLAPNPKGAYGAIPRISYASEAFRRAGGDAYRAAVDFLYRRYGRNLLGIHVSEGPWSEHFAWDALTQIGSTPLEKAGFSCAASTGRRASTSTPTRMSSFPRTPPG